MDDVPRSRKIGCTICGLVVYSLEELSTHAMSHARHSCKSCGKRFLSQHKLTTHLTSVHLKLKPFSCRHGLCGDKFVSKHEAKYHSCASKNRRTRYEKKCKDCDDVDHTEDKQFQCKICEQKLKNKSALVQHLKKEHAPDRAQPEPKTVHKMVHKSLKDVSSDSETDTEYNLRRPRREKVVMPTAKNKMKPRQTVHGGEMKRRCEVRKMETENEQNDIDADTRKIAHVEPQPNAASSMMSPGPSASSPVNVRIVKCSICNQTVTSTQLPAHQMTHREKPHKCHCGKSFTTESALRLHQVIHTGENPYVCNVCGKHFSNPRSILPHKRKHLNPKPYICSFCGEAFSMSKSIKNHLSRIHNVEKPIAVYTPIKTKDEQHNIHEVHPQDPVFIQQTETTKNVQDSVIDSTKRNHPFEDSTGGKTSTDNRGTGINHSRLLNSEKPYCCSFCDTRFTAPGNRNTHERRFHANNLISDVGNFLCSVCGLCFTREAVFKCHEKTHESPRENPPEKQKNQLCSYCGKRFGKNSRLKIHERVHTGETPFHCKICGQGFIQNFSCKKHEAKHRDKELFNNDTGKDTSKNTRQDTMNDAAKCTINDTRNVVSVDTNKDTIRGAKEPKKDSRKNISKDPNRSIRGENAYKDTTHAEKADASKNTRNDPDKQPTENINLKPRSSKNLSCPICFLESPTTDLNLEHIHLHHYDYQHPSLTLCYICGSLVQDAASHRLTHAESNTVSKLFNTKIISQFLEKARGTLVHEVMELITPKAKKDVHVPMDLVHDDSETDPSDETNRPERFDDFESGRELSSLHLGMESDTAMEDVDVARVAERDDATPTLPHNSDNNVERAGPSTQIVSAQDLNTSVVPGIDSAAKCHFAGQNPTIELDPQHGDPGSVSDTENITHLRNHNVSTVGLNNVPNADRDNTICITNTRTCALAEDLDLWSEEPLPEDMSILEQLLKLGEDFYDEQLLDEVVILPGIGVDPANENFNTAEMKKTEGALGNGSIIDSKSASGRAQFGSDGLNDAVNRSNCSDTNTKSRPGGRVHDNPKSEYQSDNIKERLKPAMKTVGESRPASCVKKEITCAMCGNDCYSVGFLADHILAEHAD